MPLSADTVWRDYATGGVPSSGPHQPIKSEIRDLLRPMEAAVTSLLSSGLVFGTLAAINAQLGFPPATMGWVIADPVVANNGIYQKLGGTGAGSWLRVGDLPYDFVQATDAGAGTPNAITATSQLPISSDTLVAFVISEANTASPVTVAFNGAAALTIKTASGGDIAPGGFSAGMAVLGWPQAGAFRLLSDQASAAIQAAAEDAQAAAEDARDLAIEAADQAAVEGAGDVPMMPSRALAIAATIPTARSYVQVQGYTTHGDGGAALYKKVVSEPAHAGKFQSADGAWWELAEPLVNAKMFGAKGDGATDDTAAINAALAANATVYLPQGDYRVSGSIIIGRTAANYLFGAGPESTTITATSTTESAIELSNPPPLVWGIKNLAVFRSVTPTSTAHGIYAYSISNRGLIEDVICTGHFHGLVIGPANFGWLNRVIPTNNFGHGLYMINTATSSVLQWEVTDLLPIANEGDGFRVETVAGMASCTVGNWERIHTFGNSGCGVRVVGLASCPIFNIRWSGAFLGADGADEIHLDTHAPDHGAHIITNVAIELVGTQPTGPTLTTPATNAGNGINVTANNGYVSVADFWINGCSNLGIVSEGEKIVLNNGIVQNCGLAHNVGQRIGILVNAGAAQITTVSSFNSVGTVHQEYGIALGAGADGCLLDNIDLSCGQGNTVLNLVDTSNGLENEILSVKGNNLRGMSDIAVGVSPFEYITGPMAETVFFIGGTLTGTYVEGVGIIAATNTSIALPPNTSLTVVYSVAPIMRRLRH